MILNIALILAGGTGTRMELDIPKQFLALNNIPIIIRTILAFERHENIDKIVLVSHTDYINELESLIKEYLIKKVIKIISGGKTRYESSCKGVLWAKEILCDNDIILIHDAARPFVTKEIINENISLSTANGACVTGIDAEDSLIKRNGNHIDKYIKRQDVLIVQTPQSIRVDMIDNLYKNLSVSEKDFTDDGSFFIANGLEVSIAQGNKTNFKITTSDDITLAKYLLSRQKNEY